MCERLLVAGDNVFSPREKNRRDGGSNLGIRERSPMSFTTLATASRSQATAFTEHPDRGQPVDATVKTMYSETQPISKYGPPLIEST